MNNHNTRRPFTIITGVIGCTLTLNGILGFLIGPVVIVLSTIMSRANPPETLINTVLILGGTIGFVVGPLIIIASWLDHRKSIPEDQQGNKLKSFVSKILPWTVITLCAQLFLAAMWFVVYLFFKARIDGLFQLFMWAMSGLAYGFMSVFSSLVSIITILIQTSLYVFFFRYIWRISQTIMERRLIIFSAVITPVSSSLLIGWVAFVFLSGLASGSGAGG